MKKKIIKVTCSSSHKLSLDELIPFQGEIKTLSDKNLEKLKQSMIKYGITVPGFIWKSGKINYVLDMHQRIKALQSLKEDGYKIPLIPIDYIQAKTKKEAKEKLLHISSQYGEFDMVELEDFIDNIDMDVSTLNIDGLITEFIEEDKEIKEKEITEIEVTHKCPQCGYEY